MYQQDTTEQRRLQLDGRIAAIRAEIQYLLQQRNALAPIATLPTEVLAEVFVILRDMVYEACTSRAPILWRALTHTCQAWRFVAIQCPRLWSVVDIHRNNVPWSFLMIARARSVPLSITVRNLLSFQEEIVMTEIAGCMASVRELSVELNHAMNPTVRALFMSAPAPILDTLKAAPPEGRWDLEPKFPLDGVFNGQTPRLKTFVYSGADIVGTSSIFFAKSITRLDISIMAQDESLFFARETRQNFAKMLCTLEHLERLRFCSNTRQRGSLPPTKKVSLPKLRILELSAEPDLVASIMECMILPVTVHLRLEVRHTEIGSNLSKVIWQHCDALALEGSLAMHGVHLVRRDKDLDHKDWIMRAWHSKQGGDTDSCLDGAPWFEITCQDSRMDEGVFLEQIAKSFQRMFADTQDVWIVLGHGLAFPSSWSAVFAALPAVQTLRLVGYNVPCFQLLATDTFRNGRLPLPALKDVTFYDACFHRGQMVVPWLDARQQLGFEIDSISMVRCTHGWTTVEEEAFRDAVHSSVGDVIWWDLSKSVWVGA
jgi:hypothetical protein